MHFPIKIHKVIHYCYCLRNSETENIFLLIFWDMRINQPRCCCLLRTCCSTLASTCVLIYQSFASQLFCDLYIQSPPQLCLTCILSSISIAGMC